MRIRNKLFIINVSVFLLFIAIFSIFVATSFRLLNLKDLQREASIARNSILKLEYANRVVLNANEAPINALQRAGQEVTDSLNHFSENEHLIYINENTVSRIFEIKELFYERDFDNYFAKISEELSKVRPRLYNTTLELKVQDMEEQGVLEDPLYVAMVDIQKNIKRFILWHRPLADSFVSVTNSIIAEVQSQISTIIIQTGLTVFAGILLSLVLIIFIYRNMINKLNHVSIGIRKISSGDLLTRINIESGDELATIGQNFNLLTETIWQKLNNIGSIIHNMGQSLSSDADALTLEQSILDLAIENTHADSGALYIPDYEERMILCRMKSSSFVTPYEDEEFNESIPFGKNNNRNFNCIRRTLVPAKPGRTEYDSCSGNIRQGIYILLFDSSSYIRKKCHSPPLPTEKQ